MTAKRKEKLSIYLFHRESRNLFYRFIINNDKSKGFTAVELVFVIVILGILAGVFLTKTSLTTQDYSSIAVDQLIADIQFVQIKTMGLRKSQTIAFQINAANYGIYTVAGEQKILPGNIKVTNTSFSGPITFNSLGEPDNSGTIDLAGGKAAGGQTIIIYGSTGKVEKIE